LSPFWRKEKIRKSGRPARGGEAALAASVASRDFEAGKKVILRLWRGGRRVRTSFWRELTRAPEKTP